MANKTQIRTLPVFPGDAPRRMNVALQVLRNEPAIALLRMLKKTDGKINKKVGLTRELSNLAGSSISVSRYLDDTLVPSALVSKCDLGLSDNPATYSLSKSGEKYCAPLTDFTLRYSVDNDFWLGDALGRGTGVLGIKTCGRRYSILKALYASNSPVTKLTLQLDSHSSYEAVSGDLAELVSLGLVDSKCIDIDTFGFRSIGWKGGDPEMLTGSQNRSARIVGDFLKGHRRASLREIVSGTKLPASKIMSAIITLKENRLASTFDEFPITRKYEIEMSEKGKEHWNGYFVPLNEFLSDRAALPGFDYAGDAEPYLKRAMEVFKERTSD